MSAPTPSTKPKESLWAAPFRVAPALFAGACSFGATLALGILHARSQIAQFVLAGGATVTAQPSSFHHSQKGKKEET
jgi:hypothetical protein